MAEPFLSVSGLSMRFGGLLAVDGIAFSVAQHEIFAIIGPNGAGKTTVFNCISGFYRPTTGKITLQGRNLAGIGSHKVARRGVVRTFQNVRLFKHMTVLENLLVAQHLHLKTSLPAGLIGTRAYHERERAALQRAVEWLDHVELRQYANREAGTLAYGHQRRLEIARCMVTEPSVLMLDEPAAGLNPQEKKELQGLIEHLRTQWGVTVLLIDHDMSLVMGVSERILVMEHGRPIALDVPDVIRHDERVVKAYLGEE